MVFLHKLCIWFPSGFLVRIRGEIDPKTTPSSKRFLVVLMCGGVNCGPHYSAWNGKSYYKYAHNSNHEQCC